MGERSFAVSRVQLGVGNVPGRLLSLISGPIRLTHMLVPGSSPALDRRCWIFDLYRRSGCVSGLRTSL